MLMLVATLQIPLKLAKRTKAELDELMTVSQRQYYGEF